MSEIEDLIGETETAPHEAFEKRQKNGVDLLGLDGPDIVLLALAVILLLTGVASQVLVLRAIGAEHPHWHDVVEISATLLKELGVALLVGLLIRKLIEERHQALAERELQRVITSKLHPTVAVLQKLNKDFGVTLRNPKIIPDRDAREQLNDKILRPTWIRRGYELRLTLRGQGNGETIWVQTDTRYAVENVSQDAQEYTITGWIDTARDKWIIGSAEAHFTRLTFGLERKNESDAHRPLELDPRAVPNLRLDRTDESLTLRYPSGEQVPAGGKLAIRLVAEQYMYARDQFVWNMYHMTQDLDVIVELAGSLSWDNFTLTPQLMHHKDQFEKGSPEISGNVRTWRLKSILLPYQGVDIWWAPKVPIQLKATTSQ